MRKLFLLCLLVSCGQSPDIAYITKEVPVPMEKVKCYSDGSYTECSVINKAVRILDVEARRQEDCTKDLDYYLLDEKTLVTRNNCQATFLLEVE